MEFLYTAWIRDRSLMQTDQDFEWPACFIINANTKEQAHEWGDVLSRSRTSESVSEEFVKSNVAESSSEQQKLPKVDYGQTPSNEYVGW